MRIISEYLKRKMEKIQSVESTIEQAFDFGVFGANTQYQSFKYEDLTDSTEIELSQDLTGTLNYTNDEGVKISKDLVIKIINTKCPYAFKHLAFLSEISIHRRIFPQMEKYSQISSNFAHFYYGTVTATYDKDDAVIILERLNNTQASPRFWDYRHLLVAMEFLGKFHAISYSAKVKEPLAFLPQMRRIHEINFSSFGNYEISPELENLYFFNGSIDDYIKKTIIKKPEPISVICLGILNTSKISFQYDSSGHPACIKFTDLFGARYAPPAYDLMNIMYSCINKKVRDEYWNEAFELYYKTLIDNADQNDIPSFADIQSDFKSYSLVAYVTASTVLAKYFDDETAKVILHEIENDILARNVVK